jgi:hypothetical protein
MTADESVMDVAKRIVDKVDGMADSEASYKDAVVYVAKEIQSSCKLSIIETLKTVQSGVVDMTTAMINVTDMLLDGSVTPKVE